MVVLRWTIIGYLYQELLMLLRASASKQRLPTSLVATYPPHKVPWQHSLCILTCLKSRHQRCSEVLYLTLESSPNFWLFSQTQQWAPRLPASAHWSPSTETSCSEGLCVLSHHCSCKSSWESQSWTFWIPCRLPRQAAWRAGFCLKGTPAGQPSAELGEGETALRDSWYRGVLMSLLVREQLQRWIMWSYATWVTVCRNSTTDIRPPLAGWGHLWCLATTGFGKKWGSSHIPCLDLCSETGRNCHCAHFVGNNDCMCRK